MLKQIQSLTLFTLATTALLISACTQPPYDSKSNMTGSAAAGSPVVFIDKDLRRTLVVDGGVTTTKTSARLLHIQTTLRNITNDQTLSIQVQTIFFDAEGQALYTDVGSESAWQNFTLTPGQTSYYKQNALTTEAKSYKIRVRYMNRQDAGN